MLAIYLDALFQIDQMRRGKKPGCKTRVFQDGGHHNGRRTFSLSARDMNTGKSFVRIPRVFKHFHHPVKTECRCIILITNQLFIINRLVEKGQRLFV